MCVTVADVSPQTDPEVTDIDDVVGLCSGQFVTQPVPGQTQDVTQDVLRQTQQDFHETSRPGSRNLETQDTVILTGPSGRSCCSLSPSCTSSCLF